MHRPATNSTDRQASLLRAVALRTFVALVLLAALVAGILHLSTSKSDRLAIARQNQLVQIGVSRSMAAIANDQEASTYWDDAVIRTRERPLDLEWIDNNLGVWFHTYYGHDEAYLLDPSNASIYAMQNGVRAQPTSFARVRDPVLGLATRLRQRMATSYIAAEGAPGKTVGGADIAIVAGRPAIVSVKPIVSETGDIAQKPGSEYLHVAVRYLDGSFLSRLTTLYGIDEARFGWKPADGASLAIRNRHGAVLGYISWTPFEPGQQVANRMVPALIAALLVVGVIISILLARIWRSRMELEASRAQAQHLAFHDSLTGLPNRSLFDDRLEHALSRRGAMASVLLLDLDRFKHVNDTMGHQAGDALIREFGRRLSALTRECDTISRLGGDEFAILVEDNCPEGVQRLARRILSDVKRPFDVVGTEIHVGVSIGIALTEDNGAEAHELVRKADIALYRAKDAGRNTFCLFSADMDASVQLRSTIEDELREALASGKGLCLHYQPQVGSGGNVIGLEALVRWDHPVRGLIAPEQFVPVAEESGLIVPLGEWVLRQAFRASRRWPGLFVAVNLSPIQFRSAGFFERLMEIVQSTGADPASIQLEVTERVLLDDDDAVKAALAKLRATGFTIALDDFGTGYSSLSYLRKFEVDKIKIDRSFVEHLGEASDSGAIVTAVLALGQAMGLAVAAEGVETDQQRQFLSIAGCSMMQGYFFSRPLPIDEIEALLASGGSSSAVA